MDKNIDQNIKGDHNKQTIIENQINIQTSVTEARIREISMESAREISNQYFVLSQDMANFRMKNFEDIVLNRFSHIENGLNAFMDPSFVLSYRRAQIQAAITDDKNNYQMLSELLAQRHEKKEDNYTKTGINGAIEIVNDISDSSLAALSILACFSYGIVPFTNDINEGLTILNNSYSKILICDLPTDNYWADQLDILNAIRVVNISSMQSFDEVFAHQLGKYIETGIKKGSDNHKKALELQDACRLNLLVDNALNSDYVVVRHKKEEVESLYRITPTEKNSLTDSEKKIIYEIMDLYIKDETVLNQRKKEFAIKVESFEYLKKISDWWNKIPVGCSLTSIGRVLGYANARKCDEKFPVINI